MGQSLTVNQDLCHQDSFLPKKEENETWQGMEGLSCTKFNCQTGVSS